MSEPFEDLNLSANQINADYTWKQIQTTSSKVDSKVYDNIATNYLVVSNQDNTFVDDPVFSDVTLLGTSLTNTNSGKIINIGHGSVITNSDTVIKIGGSEGGSDTIVGSDNNIVISYDTDVGTVGASSNNIILGNDNDIANGTRNIFIGHQLGIGGLTSDAIIIANRPLFAAPVTGSIILGGGPAPSALAKFQLLSNDLINMTNNAGNANYNPADGAANQATNGWLRLKYKGQNVKIPVLNDDDNPVP